MKRRLKTLLIFLISLIVLFVFSLLLSKYLETRRGRYEMQENVLSIQNLPDWLPLPPSANKISYCRIERFKFTAYEFNLAEEDFLSWFKEYPMNRINRPVQILRYNAYFVPPPEKNDPQLLREYESKRRAIVYGGYEYYHNDGYNPSIHIVYDTGAGRAYFIEN